MLEVAIVRILQCIWNVGSFDGGSYVGREDSGGSCVGIAHGGYLLEPDIFLSIFGNFSSVYVDKVFL